MSEQATVTCPVCGRTDVTLLKDGTIRMHSDKRRVTHEPWFPRCKGWHQKPVSGS